MVSLRPENLPTLSLLEFMQEYGGSTIIHSQEWERFSTYADCAVDVRARNTSLMRLMLSTGATLRELLQLKFEDVYTKDLKLRRHVQVDFNFQGKGTCPIPRKITILRDFTSQLEEYACAFWPREEASTLMFRCTRTGLPLKFGSARTLIQMWGKLAGVPRVGCRLMRSTHTAYLSYLGYTLSDLQHQLGLRRTYTLKKQLGYWSDLFARQRPALAS